MADPTKRDVLKIYQVYLGKIDKQIADILQTVPAELDEEIMQLDRLSKDLEATVREHQKIAGTSTMTKGLPETAQQILAFQEKIVSAIELPLNEIHKQNNKIRETLAQLKAAGHEVRKHVETKLNQTNPTKGPGKK